jgi:hypothetical protein
VKAIEKELDRLVQQLCANHRCHVCGCRQATAIHHIIGRANKILRYSPINLLPVCDECHRDIHDKNLDVSSYMHKDRWLYLQKVKNLSYKDILTFELGMSEDEFLQDRKKMLKKMLGK